MGLAGEFVLAVDLVVIIDRPKARAVGPSNGSLSCVSRTLDREYTTFASSINTAGGTGLCLPHEIGRSRWQLVWHGAKRSRFWCDGWGG